MSETHRPALAALLVLLIGAAIYLPGLGVPELRGEEPRRTLPARTMMQTGDWLVPQWGGEPYSKKPPLVNWSVAAAMKATGKMDEFSVRLVSVVCVLLTALALLFLAPPLVGQVGAFASAILFLIAKATIEKGHLIEIEALYTFTFGAAWFWWWSFDKRGKPWLAWLGAGLFLGLGMLAKGPLLCVFFVCLYFAVKGKAGLRQLLKPPAIVGILICVAMFLAWAIPNSRLNPAGNSSNVWMDQLSNRIGGKDFTWGHWLTGLPFILLDFAPASLFIPLMIRGARPTSQDNGPLDSATARRLLWTLGLGILIMGLGPSLRPRFAMPLLPVACLMAGWAMTLPRNREWIEPCRRGLIVLAAVMVLALIVAPFLPHSNITPSSRTLTLTTALASAAVLWAACFRRKASLTNNLVASGLLGALAWQVYIQAVWPRQTERETYRPPAAALIKTIRGNGVASWPTQVGDLPVSYALGMGNQPFLFYLGPDCHEALTVDQLPEKAPVVFTTTDVLPTFSKALMNKYGPPTRRSKLSVEIFDQRRIFAPVVVWQWN